MKIEVKIPRKCHSSEAQPSRGTKGKSDEEEKEHTNATYEITDAQTKRNCNRGTASERPLGKLLAGGGRGA